MQLHLTAWSLHLIFRNCTKIIWSEGLEKEEVTKLVIFLAEGRVAYIFLFKAGEGLLFIYLTLDS